MTRLSVDEILEATSWSDVRLRSISWIENGRDVVLRVGLAGTERDRDRLLVCRWVHGLVVDLTFAEGHGGYPLTWDSTFTRGPDGTWSVRLDFAHAGEVRLKCNEIEVLAADAADTSRDEATDAATHSSVNGDRDALAP